MSSCDGLRIWRPLKFPDIEIHRGREKSAVMPRHVHDEVQIGAYEGGIRQFRIGGRDFDATAGSVVVIPSGEPHSGFQREADTSSFHVMFISPSRLASASSEVGRADIELAPLTGRTPLYSRVLSLASAFSDGSALEQGTLLLELAAGLFRAASRPLRQRGESFAIRLAQDYLRAHHADAVTLDELAFQVGLNKHYLVRAFRKAIGVPPHAYQLQLRVARAKELLARGHSVSHIAAALGFADQSHFVRIFQRYVGIAPGRYQKQVKAPATSE